MSRQFASRIIVELPGDTQIRMIRSFRAPKQLVFDAHTKPEHLRQWWGLKGSTLSVCEVDLRVGGRWRFVQRAETGEEFGFGGEYREIVPPDRLSYTFGFDGIPGKENLETLTFAEEDGVTTLYTDSVFDSREDRDGMIESGMEFGANESMDRLEELLSGMLQR